MEIDAILFDWVGVLLFPRKDYIPDEFVDNVEEMLCRTVDDISMKAKVLSDYRLSESEFNSVLNAIVSKYESFPELWMDLKGLKAKYKLGVINNGTRFTLPMFNARFDIEAHFDQFINSAVEGLEKPDERIYNLTCERLEVDPLRCLFMDDLLENVEGARKVGMRTIWWDDRNRGLRLFKDAIGCQNRNTLR